MSLSIHLHPLSHIEKERRKISDHSQVFVTEDKDVFMCVYRFRSSEMDDGSIREIEESEIAN